MPSLLPILPVIVLAFDPVIQIGDYLVRIQTLALAAVLFVALVLAALVARQTPVETDRSPDATDPSTDEPNHLRRDDLLYIVVAAIPGAVIGGRIGYVLIHLDYYRANSGALLDISQGGLELSMAIIGGTLTAAVVGSLLGVPLRRWMDALIGPLLFAIAAGKLVMMLGGEGQGVPFDAAWSTAYLGAGPWLSLAPAVPSHPSQAYEGLAAMVVLGVVLLASGSLRRVPGAAFLAGITLWAVARLAVAFTWRDPQVVGPLSADQVIAIVIAIGCVLLLGAFAAQDRRAGRDGPVPVAGGGTSGVAGPAKAPAPRNPSGEPDWPDPSTRPRI